MNNFGTGISGDSQQKTARRANEVRQYKHVVLGLILFTYISETFEEHRAKLLAGEADYAGANAEDPDKPSGARQPAAGSPKGQRGGAEQYKAENVFRVPAEARWSHLQASAKQPTVGMPNCKVRMTNRSRSSSTFADQHLKLA